jgi:hypothetical protein
VTTSTSECDPPASPPLSRHAYRSHEAEIEPIGPGFHNGRKTVEPGHCEALWSGRGIDRDEFVTTNLFSIRSAISCRLGSVGTALGRVDQCRFSDGQAANGLLGEVPVFSPLLDR